MRGQVKGDASSHVWLLEQGQGRTASSKALLLHEIKNHFREVMGFQNLPCWCAKNVPGTLFSLA